MISYGAVGIKAVYKAISEALWSFVDKFITREHVEELLCLPYANSGTS